MWPGKAYMLVLHRVIMSGFDVSWSRACRNRLEDILAVHGCGLVWFDRGWGIGMSRL